MRCIKCDANTAVVDKRTSMDNVTRRRRKCLKCSERFTTKEVLLEDIPSRVYPKLRVKVIQPKVVKQKPPKPLSPEKQNLINLFTKRDKHE